MIEVKKAILKFDYSSPNIENIRRNLAMLYATKAGSVPMDRDFGLECDFVSKPLPVAKSEFEFEVIRKTEIYEPGVQVEKVEYIYDEINGMMQPVIYLKGAGE